MEPVMSKTIMILGRGEEHLTEREKAEVKQRYGADVQFVRYDPTSADDHLANCKRLAPVVVLLPPEEPIYAQAVRNGVQHITYGHGRKGFSGLLRVVHPRYDLQNFTRHFPVELAYWYHY